ELDPWHVDLDAVVQAGNRRVRRRRALVSGGVAAVLAVVGGAALLTGRGTTTAEPLPTDTTGGKPFSYAVGSVIHSGAATIDVGFKVNSFVQMADGFVVSDPQKQVYVERDGHAQR